MISLIVTAMYLRVVASGADALPQEAEEHARRRVLMPLDGV
ncbi:hypothetical protein [Amycolatopsis taiwanensis]|nr:hypothetical protein [Amycolatopsis taiwanensis]